MSKAPSPLLGYNNNVRHKNRVFHIQTEDSGVKHPHVITHLFMDGGRILKSVKRSYAEHVGSDGLADTVRAMMKEQHKAMFIALRDGQFDHLVEAAVEGSQRPSGAAPPPSTAAPRGASAAVSASVPPSAPQSTAAPQSAAVPVKPATPAPEKAPPPSRVEAPATVRESALTLDIDALERAAAADKKSGPLAPPEPAATTAFAKRTDTGRYRSIPARETAPSEIAGVRKPAAVPPPPGAASPPRPLPTPAAVPRVAAKKTPTTSGDGRYAPARPAAIFGQARPQTGSSIFGEDLISDKSLDEVILSYLAEDLETEKK